MHDGIDETTRIRAYRAEIRAAWQPRSTGDRVLDARSRALLSLLLIFGEVPTLAWVGAGNAARILVEFGITVSPQSPAQGHVNGQNIPGWATVLVVASACMFTIECLRSVAWPSARRFALLGNLPMAVGSAIMGWLFEPIHPFDVVMRPGMFLIAIGNAVMGAGLLLRHRRARSGRGVRVGLSLMALGGILFVGDEMAWAVEYWRHGAGWRAFFGMSASVTIGASTYVLLKLRPAFASF
ncbi:MAG: hypothetical protein AB7L13_11535 [Acidimicrobiia bacterium]